MSTDMEPYAHHSFVHVPIGCNAIGDNTIVASVAGRSFAVTSMALFARAPVEIYFKASGGAIVFGDDTQKIRMDNTGFVGAQGFILNDNRPGWMRTPSSEGLVLNLSAYVGV